MSLNESKKRSISCWFLKIMLLGILALPEIAGAQYFYQGDTSGDIDVDLGFRKTGIHQEAYETLVYLGNITNLLKVPAGTQITITNYSTSQLSTMCPDGFGNLQWSAFAALNPNASLDSYGIPTALGEFPDGTVWYTIPRTNVNLQTTAPLRLRQQAGINLEGAIYSVELGATEISSDLGTTNADNNTLVILEPDSSNSGFYGYILTDFIGDLHNPSLGDFQGNAFNYSVENVTSNKFTSAAVSDFYQVLPVSNSSDGTFTDPITGATNGPAYWVGYFTLNPSGSMTFTRATAVTVTAPSAGTILSAITNGFSPLTVVFTNTASGSITNWVWNFGNGNIITNSTGNDVTNTYAASGDYSVTLTVYGPGGSASVTQANYIVASPAPIITASLSGSNFVLSGTNCPAGVQYRILTTSSLTQTLAAWTPVVTNKFLSNGTFSFTSPATNSQTYFRLVSP